MDSNRLPTRRDRARALVRLALIGLVSVVAGGLASTGCLNRPLCDTDCRPATTNVFVDAIQQKSVDKIDLLFMIDNSISMADKQSILAAAVPDLVDRLVNPVCVDDNGVQAPQQPANPSDPCPNPGQYKREFNPIGDIHIGVISSSLGSQGTDLCQESDGEQRNDHAHLLGSRPRAAGIPGIDQNLGFLAWGPGVQLPTLKDGFSQLVTKVGEQGCGFESSLEAWYRFLVDPKPPETVQVSNCGKGQCAAPVGLDQAVLDQRRAFLRSDSLVAVIMLTDENDCSIQNTGQLFYAARRDITLPRASSPCATNPNDPCCYSCGVGPDPSKCPNPPDDCSNAKLSDAEDEINLRCFAQKRRFGISFLYPTARYINALTQFQLCTSRADVNASDAANCPDNDGDGAPDVVPNPLFQDLSGMGGIARDPSLVFFAGIVGVPWQDLATQESLNNTPGQDPLKYLTAADIASNGVWDQILGDPAANPPVAPADPHMVESTQPRAGVAGPNAGLFEDPIVGHDWGNVKGDDLMYACIFPLPEQQRDCAALADSDTGCDCKTVEPNDNNPLCQAMDGSYGTNQYYAKAYPGLRHLEVLKGFGDNSIVASICARNVSNQGAPDYGYRPAIGAIVDRLKEALSGRCLPRQLTVNDNGTPDNTLDDTVPCSIVEAIPQAGAGCDTNRQRANVTDEGIVAASFRRLELSGKCGADVGRACDQSAWTLCEIKQATVDQNPQNGVLDCQEVDNPMDIGWCYVDPDNGIGAKALVENCAATERRLLRFVDPNNNTPTKGATALIACLGAELQEDPANTGAVNTAPGGSTGGMNGGMTAGMTTGGMTNGGAATGGAAGGATTGGAAGGATTGGAPLDGGGTGTAPAVDGGP